MVAAAVCAAAFLAALFAEEDLLRGGPGVAQRPAPASAVAESR
ncbi:hypothetical protein ACIQCJ_12590 [Streptomyces sp. NPDC093221]